jgi:hypothetical protein
VSTTLLTGMTGISLRMQWPLTSRTYKALLLYPGANPKTSSYNASVVKIYNATSSLLRFEKKYFLLL